MNYRLTLLCTFAIVACAGQGTAQAPTTEQKGPVQGYQGGYDPVDKSKAPAAPDGNKMDAANPSEGRHVQPATGQVTHIDGPNLTLDNGLVLVVPPTLQVDQSLLSAGTRIKARFERKGGANVITEITRD
jgi:hypothetical protein